MFEKHREANSLAAISRAVAEQRTKEADEHAAKPVKPPQPDAAVAAPVSEPASKEKKEKKRKKTKEAAVNEVEEHQAPKEKKRKEYKKKREEIHPAPDTATPPPAAPALPSVDDAFRDWFMARLAEDFETEIEGLNEADAPVGTRALLQALEGSLALFSQVERRVALAAAGIHAGIDADAA